MVEATDRRIDAPRLRTFRDAFGGVVVLPGDDAYDAARAVWNGMIDRRPAIVVRPLNAADVIAALRFARDEDLIVAVRSGGHSMAGLSTCDDGIIIDLARMRGVTVDPDRRVARCNGGALLGELDDAAQAFGLACNVGTVSHTGIAGLTLGGGMGRLQRKLGLTIDCLRAVELVTADGRLVRASADENADLFWGMRGAGPNFGIVTALEFNLEAQHAYDDSMGWGHRVYTKSGYVSSLPDALVDAFVDHAAGSPPGEDVFSIWAFGGAVGRIPEEATAFQGRTAPFWVGTETQWDDPADDQSHRAWARTGIGLIEPYRVVGGYVNDVSETGDDALVRSVYGDAKYERLVALKRAWDPDNVFRLNQNIRP